MSADSIGNVRQQIANGNFFPCRRPDLRMALLENNQKYDFYGVFDIQVLFGSVEARGYNFESSAYNEKKFISICAPYVMGPPIVISTKSSENTFNVNRLKWRIQEVSDASVELLDLYKGGDAIVLLRFHIPKAALCVRNLYDVKFFVPSSGDYLMLETLCCVSKSRSRKVLENEHLSSVVNYLKKRRNGKESSVVVLTGGKGVGKSMCSRYIANSLLTEGHSPVYYLDIDVGQSETNPPGCISLFSIETPMLGVPFMSQRTALNESYFFGDITPSTNISLFKKLVTELYRKFHQNTASGSVLIVNTPGWVDGEGRKLLDCVIEAVNPNCLYNIITYSGPNYESEVIRKLDEMKQCFVVQHKIASQYSLSLPLTLTPSALRNLLILGYISSLCPTPSLGSLCDSTPYSVPFDRISVHLNQELGALPETHLFAALNCALVALCSVQWDSDQIKGKRHILEDETMPGYIIDNEVMLRCFGFGMIRAIDIEERLFYVLTPVDRQLLNEVNVFSKGANIDIPNAFLSQQKARDAPYVVRCNKNGLTDGMYNELKLISCYKHGQPRRHIV